MNNGIILWIFMRYLHSVRSAGVKGLFKNVTSKYKTYKMIGHGVTLGGGSPPVIQ